MMSIVSKLTTAAKTGRGDVFKACLGEVVQAEDGETVRFILKRKVSLSFVHQTSAQVVHRRSVYYLVSSFKLFAVINHRKC